MKSTSKLKALKEKELINKEEIRGGNPDVDKPRRPGGGARPPFGRVR